MFISWRLITLQYCSGFCHTLTWISHGFTCVPHPDPPPSSLLALNVEGRTTSQGKQLATAAVESLRRVRLCATPETAAHRAPPSMGFSRQEDWSGVPLLSLAASHYILVKAGNGFFPPRASRRNQPNLHLGFIQIAHMCRLPTFRTVGEICDILSH